MRLVSNSLVSTLIRCLPLILANLNEDAMRTNTRLYNAARQTRIIINKLKKKGNEQSSWQGG